MIDMYVRSAHTALLHRAGWLLWQHALSIVLPTRTRCSRLRFRCDGHRSSTSGVEDVAHRGAPRRAVPCVRRSSMSTSTVQRSTGTALCAAASTAPTYLNDNHRHRARHRSVWSRWAYVAATLRTGVMAWRAACSRPRSHAPLATAIGARWATRCRALFNASVATCPRCRLGTEWRWSLVFRAGVADRACKAATTCALPSSSLVPSSIVGLEH